MKIIIIMIKTLSIALLSSALVAARDLQKLKYNTSFGPRFFEEGQKVFKDGDFFGQFMGKEEAPAQTQEPSAEQDSDWYSVLYFND